MAHRIRKTLTGKLRVCYDCPHCGNELESPLEEADRIEPCPTCSRKFQVPGIGDLKRVKAEVFEKQKLQEQVRARKQLEAEQRQRRLKAAQAAEATVQTPLVPPAIAANRNQAPLNHPGSAVCWYCGSPVAATIQCAFCRQLQ